MLLYSAALTLGLLLSSPWWLFRMLTTERYREGLAQRLGRVPQHLRTATDGKRTIWLHAVSVGEVLAASRLVAELEIALGDGWRVVISTTTRTGQALARERFGADRVFYFPLDFAFAVRAYMRALRPAAFVLMESELWPRVLHECQRAHISVVVANARVSDRSFSRAMRVHGFWGRMLRKVTLWLAQSEEDARRLKAIGATGTSVLVGGNLKYDIEPKFTPMVESMRRLLDRRSLVVAGSSLDGEEELILAEWDSVWRKTPQAVLLLAPRHPERFGQVLEMAARDGLRVYSAKHLQIVDGTAHAPARFDPRSIVVLDTIGDLAGLYSLADVAFVGGSVVPRGGHNPLEPAQFGVPIIMGTSFENFRDIIADLQKANGIRIVKDERELADAFEFLLTDKQAARTMGENGRTVFHQRQGATARAVEAIVTLVRGANA